MLLLKIKLINKILWKAGIKKDYIGKEEQPLKTREYLNDLELVSFEAIKLFMLS